MARLKHLAAILFLACCGAYYLKVNVADQLSGLNDSPSDFLHHYRAARRVLAHQSPYSDANYDYPPAISFLLAPVAMADYVTARRAWFWCSQLFLLLAALVEWRALGRGLAAACCVSAVWALGGATAENFSLGQLGPLLVLLLTLAYWGTGTWQGAALAAGFAVKFIPGVAGIVPLLRRDWRALGVVVALAMAGVLIPIAVIASWHAGPTVSRANQFVMGTPAVLNWSLPAVALRAADPPASRVRLPYNWEFGNVPENLHLPRSQRLLSAGIAAALLLSGVCALLIVSGAKLREGQAPWAAAAMIALAVAASPVSWTHYQILQYPGLAMLLCHAVRQRAWLAVSGAVVLGALLYQIPVAVLRAYYASHGGWSAASPATLYLWTTVTPVASLALFAVLLRQLRSAEERSR